MRTIKLLTVIMALLCFAGCNDSEEEYSQISIKQTLWKGTLSDENTESDISIMFKNEKSGYCVVNNENFGFSYYRDDRIIQISGYNGDLLNGEWYITKLTHNSFILKRQPLIEGNLKTLTLKRFYI